MKTNPLPFLLTILIGILSACGSAPTQIVETTRLVLQTVEVTRVVRQTVVVTQVMTETPSPKETPENSSIQKGNFNNNFDLSALLQIFPLYKGTSWSYTGVNYSQVGSDPNTIIKAVTYIDERVIDVQSQPPYYFAHIQRNTTLVNVDPGWQDNEGLGLGNYDFWYVVLSRRVYLSSDRPDPAKIQVDQLSEELDFPLTMGLSWCPNKIQRGYLTPVAETPVPCASAGARKVLAEESYKTQAGNFDHCYRLNDFFNSGGPIKWFCDGVGIVAEEYDHQGTRFGYSKEMVKFTRGSFP